MLSNDTIVTWNVRVIFEDEDGQEHTSNFRIDAPLSDVNGAEAAGRAKISPDSYIVDVEVF